MRRIIRPARMLAAFAQADKSFAVAFVLLMVAHLAPIVAVKHIPLQDGPAHLSMVRVWMAKPSDGLMASEYVRTGRVPPYLTYYVGLRLLSSVMSLEVANKVIVGLYAVALPLAFLYLLLAFGRDRRYALLSFPFIYNACFIYGFVANLMALPLLLLSLGLLKRELDAPNKEREFALAVTVAGLYLTHLLVAAAFAIAGPVIFFAHVHRPKQIIRRSVFVWPTLALAVYWVVQQMGGSGHGRISGHMRDVAANMQAALGWINDIRVGSTDEIVLLVVVGTIIACIGLPERSPTIASMRRPWALAAAALAVCLVYFITPATLYQPFNHWATNARLVLPAVLLLLTLPRADMRGMRGIVLLPAALVMLWGAAETLQGFRAFDAQMRHFDRVVTAIPANKRVLPLVYDQTDGIHQGFVMRHVGKLYQVRRGGYLPGFWTIPVMPVRLRGKPTPTPFYKTPERFQYAQHGKYYDYFLTVRAPGQPAADSFPGAGGNVKLVAASGRFAVYRNRIPPADLTR